MLRRAEWSGILSTACYPARRVGKLAGVGLRPGDEVVERLDVGVATNGEDIRNLRDQATNLPRIYPTDLAPYLSPKACRAYSCGISK